MHADDSGSVAPRARGVFRGRGSILLDLTRTSAGVALACFSMPAPFMREDALFRLLPLVNRLPDRLIKESLSTLVRGVFLLHKLHQLCAGIRKMLPQPVAFWAVFSDGRRIMALAQLTSLNSYAIVANRTTEAQTNKW